MLSVFNEAIEWVSTGFGLAPSESRTADGAQVQVHVPQTSTELTTEELFRQTCSAFDTWTPARPLNRSEELYLYALRMQATHGDVQGEQPPLYKPAARAQWRAWAHLEGDWTMARAKAKYIKEVDDVIQRHGTSDGGNSGGTGIIGRLGRYRYAACVCCLLLLLLIVIAIARR